MFIACCLLPIAYCILFIAIAVAVATATATAIPVADAVDIGSLGCTLKTSKSSDCGCNPQGPGAGPGIAASRVPRIAHDLRLAHVMRLPDKRQRTVHI